MFFEEIARKLLFLVEPEKAHNLALYALRHGFFQPKSHDDPRLQVRLAGLNFPNPLGMAAGFDKNAEIPDSLFSLGFGFVEVGTVTPLPQKGNPKPRIFRLQPDKALINRLGFNNRGHLALEAALKKRKWPQHSILGINLGANRNSSDPTADYVLGIKKFSGAVGYLAINISSPNTPGLRNLQKKGIIGDFLSRLVAARQNTPLFLKISPDLSEKELENIAYEVHEKKIEGVIVSNTTTHFGSLHTFCSSYPDGGLSGKPLFHRSNALVARMRNLLGEDHAIIGVGGVDSAESALEKIRAGADAVQLYTGLIYEGLSLPYHILDGLSKILDRQGVDSLSQLRSDRLSFWLRQPLKN